MKKLLEKSLQRRTTRSFTTEQVDIDKIKTCLEIASTAPSGANKQPYHYYVIRNKELKKQIRQKSEEIEFSFYQDKISDEWRNDLKKLKTNHEKPFLEEADCLIACFKEMYGIDNLGNKTKNYYISESALLSIGLLINAINEAGYNTLTYTPAPNNFLCDILNTPQNLKPIMILVVGVASKNCEYPKLTKKQLSDYTTFLD